MDLLNSLIDTYNIPILTAFLVGILTSISPCPLATNITAIAFISKDIKTSKHTLLNGLFYTLGRGITYTVLTTLIYFGLSSFDIARIFQGWGDKVLGPVLIIIGLVLAGVIKINLKSGNHKIDQIKKNLSKKGYLGSLLLGMLFALAFCPYSGVLFFGLLIPLVLSSPTWFILPPMFALGTGLPVIIFSLVIAYSIKSLTKAFNLVSKIEKISRIIIAIIFIVTGLYYSQFLIKHIFSLPHFAVLGTQTKSMGYCPTMKPFAHDYQRQNPKTNLLAFDSAALALQALNKDQIDQALVGRKAYLDELTSDIKLIESSSGYTLVSSQPQNIIYSDLAKNIIYTYQPDFNQVKPLFPSDTKFKTIEKINLKNLDFDKIYLFSWQDIDGDYPLTTVYNSDGSKASQFRSPFIYSKQI